MFALEREGERFGEHLGEPLSWQDQTIRIVKRRSGWVSKKHICLVVKRQDEGQASSLRRNTCLISITGKEASFAISNFRSFAENVSMSGSYPRNYTCRPLAHASLMEYHRRKARRRVTTSQAAHMGQPLAVLDLAAWGGVSEEPENPHFMS